MVLFPAYSSATFEISCICIVVSSQQQSPQQLSSSLQSHSFPQPQSSQSHVPSSPQHLPSSLQSHFSPHSQSSLQLQYSRLHSSQLQHSLSLLFAFLFMRNPHQLLNLRVTIVLHPVLHLTAHFPEHCCAAPSHCCANANH